MTAKDAEILIRNGETSHVQFKLRFSTQKQIAEEMVAFANSGGGKILIGIDDKTGEIIGLNYPDIQSTMRELGNAANELVKPTIYIETDIVEIHDKKVLVCDVKNGANKPYKTIDGSIWIKQGADKRRVTENSEILSLFQSSGFYQPDVAGVEGTSVSDLDMQMLDGYFQRLYGRTLDSFGLQKEQVLRNVNILHKSGTLTLSGYLFFAKNPQEKCPAFMVKAVAFYGNDLGGMNYKDSKEIVGTIPELYEQGMTFMKSNLHSLQSGQSFNSIGKLEISETVLEEVYQNALVHRDYLRTAPIRILIFENRLEIVSPGTLAGGLTIESIKTGDTFQRNPHLANFCTNAMNYHGLGSGMLRVLSLQPNASFNNDEEGKQFTVSIPRISTIQNIGNQPIDDNIKSGNEKVCPSLSKLVQACPSLQIESEETIITLLSKCINFVSASEFSSVMPSVSQKTFVRNYIKPLLESGFIIPLYSETPTHPFQKYRLSETGLEVLNNMKAKKN